MFPPACCRVLIAALSRLEADFLCPAAAVYVNNPHPHLCAYCSTVHSISAGRLEVEGLSSAAEQAGARQLAAALDMYMATVYRPKLADAELLQLVRLQQQVARSLEQPDVQAQLDQALAALSAGRSEGLPPFSLQHVQFVCNDQAVYTALELCTPPIEAGPAGALTCIAEHLRRPGAVEATAAARSAAAAMCRIDPGNPKSLETAGQPLPGGLLLPQLATVPRLLHAVQQAWERRSDFWVIRLTGAATNVLRRAVPTPAPAELQAVQQALQQAEAALARCKRVLPHPWANSLQAGLPLFHHMLRTAQQRLAMAQADQRGDRAANAVLDHQTVAAHVSSMISTAEQHVAEITGANTCAGCGKRAVGLRACARCRSVRYCSRECQAASWPTHKRECRPA